MLHYHPQLEKFWSETVAALGSTPLITKLLRKVKQPNGKDNYSVTSLSVQLKDNRCVVGSITGHCNTPAI